MASAHVPRWCCIALFSASPTVSDCAVVIEAGATQYVGYRARNAAGQPDAADSTTSLPGDFAEQSDCRTHVGRMTGIGRPLIPGRRGERDKYRRRAERGRLSQSPQLRITSIRSGRCGVDSDRQAANV